MSKLIRFAPPLLNIRYIYICVCLGNSVCAFYFSFSKCASLSRSLYALLCLFITRYRHNKTFTFFPITHTHTYTTHPYVVRIVSFSYIQIYNTIENATPPENFNVRPNKLPISDIILMKTVLFMRRHKSD